jgi:ABC-type phosphate transport system ATPase subunit
LKKAATSTGLTARTTTAPGVLVEYDQTERLFGDPRDDRTKAHVTSRMG